MHKYLRAVGFAQLKTQKQLQSLLDEVFDKPDYIEVSDVLDASFVTFERDYGPNMGVGIFGEYDEEDRFQIAYYYPYFKGSEESVMSDCKISRRADHCAFSVMCEDLRVGFPLIFYLQNAYDFLEHVMDENVDGKPYSICLSALSTDGAVLLPLYRTAKERERSLIAAQKRRNLVASALDGDVEAIEDLSIMETNQYAQIHQRLKVEDLYSILDTSFMPTAMECDMYAVLGDIMACEKVVNSATQEGVWQMLIRGNDDLMFHVTINERDLYGEPQVGRRFKGDIWLQGKVDFKSEARD